MKITNASVKIMRSYDYCHFEVVLSTEDGEEIYQDEVDDLRKVAMRLADKAVEQYQIARKVEQQASSSLSIVTNYLCEDVEKIKKLPKKEWTPEQKAKVKVLEEHEFLASRRYDYEDDWEQ